MKKRLLCLLMLMFAMAGNCSFADKICPTCETIFEDNIKFCPNDGTKLNEISKKDIVPFELKSLPEG
ncbi:MAG: hypothetical protein II567_17120, partial [Candidatus Riflebacteria bacterium]|nr:hypothetical protein [Candidatus Riflebacteria bacterium]